MLEFNAAWMDAIKHERGMFSSDTKWVITILLYHGGSNPNRRRKRGGPVLQSNRVQSY
jgi:hypothetical protein